MPCSFPGWKLKALFLLKIWNESLVSPGNGFYGVTSTPRQKAM